MKDAVRVVHLDVPNLLLVLGDPGEDCFEDVTELVHSGYIDSSLRQR